MRAPTRGVRAKAPPEARLNPGTPEDESHGCGLYVSEAGVRYGLLPVPVWAVGARVLSLPLVSVALG